MKRYVITWIISIAAILISFNTMGLYGDFFNDMVFPDNVVETPQADLACWKELRTDVTEVAPEVQLSITLYEPTECL